MSLQSIKNEFYNIKGSMQAIECELAELDKPKVEEGQYWGRNGEVKYISDIDGCCHPPIAYTIVTGDSSGDTGSCTTQYLTELVPHKLLTDDEVEKALIEEARRRGFEKGKLVKTNSGNEWELENDRHEYERSVDTLYYGAIKIYDNGEWAEIIEDEWGVRKFNRSFSVRDQEDMYYIQLFRRDGFPKGLNKEQAHAIAEALNNLN